MGSGARHMSRGALMAVGAASSLLLASLLLRPYLIAEPILRDALGWTLVAVATLGALGAGLGGGSARPLSAALVAPVVVAVFVWAWTGWDGLSRDHFFGDPPAPWGARLGFLAALGVGAVAARGVLARVEDRLGRLLPACVWATLVAVAALISGPEVYSPSWRSVVLVGVDAATLEILDDMDRRVGLPHLQRMLREGASGALYPEPPFSPPSWSTLATGKLPARHRIDNWDRNDRASGHRRRLRRSALESRTVFEIVDGAGLGSGVFEWPMVGREAPGIDSPLDQALVLFVSFGGRLPFLARAMVTARRSRLERAHHVFVRNERALAQLALYYWYRNRPRLLGLGIRGTDSAQHKYWTGLEPGRYGLSEAEARWRSPHIPAVYRVVDDLVGAFLSHPEATTMVFSDHGATGISAERPVNVYSAFRLRLDPFLERWGWLSRYPDGRRDLERSWLYDCSDSILHPQVCINRTDARRAATGLDAEALMARGRPRVAEAIGRFRALRFEDDGTRLFPGNYGGPEGSADFVRRSAEDSVGCWVRLSPSEDPVFFPNFDDFDLELGLGFDVRPFDPEFLSREITDGQERWGLDEVLEAKDNEGTHQTLGFVAALGPGIVGGVRARNPRTVDLVPTVLHLLSLPVGRDMDGRVWHELLEPSMAARPVEYVETFENGERWRGEGAPSGADRRLDQELRALGYID